MGGGGGIGDSGGGTRNSYGGYVKGTAALTSGQTLYVYVGSNIHCGSLCSTFNGGYNNVSTGTPGLGATDIRLTSGAWDDTASLRSRVMIAGGAGRPGGLVAAAKVGHGGGLNGYDGDGTGGTQSSGGTPDGAFGVGGSAAGGGGGYYGGGGGTWANGGGGGGSSYISGHTGAVAITSASNQAPKAGCATGTTNNACSIHYSGRTFTNTLMIDGAGYRWTNTKGALQAMPNPAGGNYASGRGHFGSGYARITYLGS